MYWKDDGDVPPPGDPRHRTANPREPAVETFAAVTRYQNQSSIPAMLGKHLPGARSELFALVKQSRHPEQGVDPGIAGDDDSVTADPFAQQVIACPRCRGEVKVGYVADEPAVDLLGPRRVGVVGAQASLDMR